MQKPQNLPEDSPENIHEEMTLDGRPAEQAALHEQSVFPLTGVDRFEIQAMLGEGGMGRVYRAVDVRLKRTVALKFIRDNDPVMAGRFLREAQSQARIEHANVCKVYEAGELEGKLYIAMQYIAGPNLRDGQKELSLEQKVKLMKDVAEGVHAAHRMGMIHRDIKPSNIMVVNSEEEGITPYVMDFGLVRETQTDGVTMTNAVVGTPWYMAPEQAWGSSQQLDRRADIYSLGATLYELLSGARPLDGASSMEVFRKLLQDEVPPLRTQLPSVPQDLENIVMKCLEKDPNSRYDSARALADDLQRYLDGEPVLARKAGLWYHLSRKARKNKLLVGTISGALLAVLILGGLTIKTQIDSSRRAEIARRFAEELKDMEWMMRVAHTIPPHDIRPQIRSIQQRMRKLNSNQKEMGAIAAGPLEYTLGRASLVLENPAQAKKHLEIAWNEGYREPEVAYSLGLTLGQLYQQELENLNQLPTEEERNKKRKQLQKDYRDPAIKYLQSAKDQEAESPEYVEGLIAYYEVRQKDAFQKAAEALQRTPWLYEAHMLRGDLYRWQANDLGQEGEYKKAMEAYLASRDSLRAAIENGRSDIRGYQKMAQVLCNIMLDELYHMGGNLQPHLEEAESIYKTAQQINPDSPKIHVHMAELYRLWGEYQVEHGQDPTDTLRKAEMAGKRGIALDSSDPQSYHWTAIAFGVRGQFELARGGNPVPDLEKTAEYLKQAIGKYRKPDKVYIDLGIVYSLRAQYEGSHGIDPAGSIKSGADSLHKATTLMPAYALAHYQLGSLHTLAAEYEYLHGKDPSASLQSAEKSYRDALQINPNHAYARAQLGASYVLRARTLLRAGQDPAGELAKAFKELELARNLHKDYWYVFAATGDAFLTSARQEIAAQKSPDAMLDKAFEYISKARSINPNDAAPVILMLDYYSVRARTAKARGQSISAILADAQKLYDDSSATIDSFANARMRMASLYSLEGSPRSQARASELIAQAHAIDPKLTQ